MFFRFDTDRWIIDQLPPVLRRKAVYAFLRAMLLPVAQLAQAFTAFRDAALRRLSTNAFVVYLEKWLNDVFFYPSGTIYITEEELSYVELSFQSEGEDPVYMAFVGELPPTNFDLYSFSPDSRLGRFVVPVPASMRAADISIVSQWVEYYKYAGTQYKIEIYG